MSVNNISIDTIIESIIDKDKNKFNKKSEKEQNNDKYKISKEINGLLRGRNNQERTEILSLLLEKVNDPSQTFLDSTGNLDIYKIKMLTNSSIKNAVEMGKIASDVQKNNSNIKSRENVIEAIVLTPIIIDKLISNYEKISIEEKEALWNEYANLSRNDQRRLENANTRGWYNLAKSASEDEKIYFENMGKQGEKLTELYDQAYKGNKNARGKLMEIIQSDEEFINQYNGDTSQYSKDIRSSFAKYIGKRYVIEQEVYKLYQNPEKSEEDKNEIIKTITKETAFIKEYKKENPHTKIEYSEDFVDDYLMFMKNRNNELSQKLGIINQKVENQNLDEDPNRFYEEQYAQEQENEFKNSSLEDIDFNLTSEPIDSSKEFLKEETRENYSKEEIASALHTYKEYFQDFDEETIEAISEMSPDEVRSNLKEDFSSMLEENEIDEKTMDILELFSDSITNSTKEILIDSKKREAFFEQIQNNLINESIKDSEVSELFERISVELQVSEVDQSKEESISQDSNIEPIEEMEAQSEFLERHENFEIDPTWEEMCRDAQAKGKALKGKTLIELLEKYKEEVELPEGEKRINPTEDREEKVGNGDVILEENQSNDSIQHFGEIGKKERVAVIKKDEQGVVTNIQVFKPIDFLRKSAVTFSQIEQEQQVLTQIAKEQMQNRNVELGQTQKQDNSEKTDKDDLR